MFRNEGLAVSKEFSFSFCTTGQFSEYYYTVPWYLVSIAFVSLSRVHICRSYSMASTISDCRQAPDKAARPKPGASYFLSGVMGGSGTGKEKSFGVDMESQDYRAQIEQAILAADPSAKIVDPLQLGAVRASELYAPGTPVESMWKEDAHVREMFADVVDGAAKADCIISFLPVASMGSAVELHAARMAGKLIVCITPGSMRGNWVVRSYANSVFESIAELADWLKASGSANHARGGE
jgi:hypothetical protein